MSDLKANSFVSAAEMRKVRSTATPDEVLALRNENDMLWNRLLFANSVIDQLWADAERYRWLMMHPLWGVSYRVKDGNTQWRMRDDDGCIWGNWHATPGAAIDAAMKEKSNG